MISAKILYSVDPVGYHRDGYGQVSLKIVGLFDSLKVTWKYYVVSTVFNSNKKMMLTNDIKSVNPSVDLTTTSNIVSYGINYRTVDEARLYIDDFKMKWETGSNDTLQQQREEKLDELIKNK